MFDPYHRWLGIPKKHRPPTHYQLLGIEPDEREPEIIEEAAIRQTTHLRAYQTGEHAELCTRLLNEIAEARTTLLDPAKRKQYDAKLAKRTSSPSSSAFANLESTPALSKSPKTGRAPTRAGRIEKQPVTGGLFGDNKTKAIVLIAGGGAALLTVVVMLVLVLNGNSSDPADPPQIVKKPPEKVNTPNVKSPQKDKSPKTEPPTNKKSKNVSGKSKTPNNKETPKIDSPKKPKIKPPKKGAGKNKTPKKETPKKEQPKDKTPKKEQPKDKTPKVELPKKSPKGIDLLAMVDPEKHARSGKWMMENGKLTTDKGVLYLPFEETQGAYELTIRARNLANDKGEHFCVGIVAGANRTLAALNALGGNLGGLERVDGIPVDQNETENPLGVLPPGKEYTLTYRVVNQRITVGVNGNTVVDWKGDLRRLTDILAKPFKIPGKRLYLYLKGPYEISQIEFYPLSPEDAMKYVPTQRPRNAANGFVQEQALNTVTKWRRGKMGPTFAYSGSWRLMLEYRLVAPDKRESQPFVFFWGDSRPGRDALFIVQKGLKLQVSVGDVIKNSGHGFVTNVKPPIQYRWIEIDLHYNAIKREFAFYVAGQLVKRVIGRITPRIDRPMPIFIGSRDTGVGRFRGWIRRVWFGNVDPKDLPDE